jgi:pimeloyl-ACP methyl ester carboxylesterase
MLAARLAQQFPEKIAALITLSSNVKFVADQSWPHAMAADVYKGFFSLVEKKSALALKRFSGFQCHGAQDEKVLIKKLRVLEETTPIADEVLTASLNLLASIDNRDLLTQIKIPALHLLGEKDGLVPAVLASELALSPSSSVKVLANLPHCLFYADADLVWQSIETFLLEQKVLSAEKSPC